MFQVDNYTRNESERVTLNLDPPAWVYQINSGITGVCEHGMLAPTLSWAQDCREQRGIPSQWEAKCLQGLHLPWRPLYDSTHRGATGMLKTQGCLNEGPFCGAEHGNRYKNHDRPQVFNTTLSEPTVHWLCPPPEREGSSPTKPARPSLYNY